MQLALNFLRCAAACAVMLVALPGPARADLPVTYKDGDRALFHFSAPDFWSVRAGGPRTLTPPGEDAPREVARVIGLEPTAEPHVWMGFVSPPGVRTLSGGRAYLREIGPLLVKEPSVASARSVLIGGRRAETFAGTGRRNGRGVNFTAVVIDLPNDRVAVSVVVLEAGVNPDIVTDVNAVFASFRAAR